MEKYQEKRPYRSRAETDDFTNQYTSSNPNTKKDGDIMFNNEELDVASVQ